MNRFDYVRPTTVSDAVAAAAVPGSAYLAAGTNLLDLMKNDQIALVINTPSGRGAQSDEGKIRAAAVAHGVTCITTVPAAHVAVEACRALRERELTVSALQDRYASANGRGA